MKFLTIVGARPQFIKAVMVSRAISAQNQKAETNAQKPITEVILHTGQHYDDNMSRIFFDQMKIPRPDYNLRIGSGTHGDTTGRMLTGIEQAILDEKPDWVLVYGDTNSTLAGALAASKLHVPVAHVEAGLRSFSKRMPEEINRILTDHIATILLCPTTTAVKNLTNEGIQQGVHHVGDVMYDAALVFGKIANNESRILDDLSLSSKSYRLATLHRAENTDNPNRLANIFAAFKSIATEECPVILPLHPRTRSALVKSKLAKENKFSVQFSNPHLKAIPPLSFLDMVMLEKHAKTILTDSGGVQKEAYFHGVPCVTLRDETEWIETVEAGWNKLVGANLERIINAVNKTHQGAGISQYGNGRCAESILRYLTL
jgi:UDP-GlcNAc3NAcA epimerase